MFFEPPPAPPALVATFSPDKPSILCKVFPKLCNVRPPIDPPDEVPIPGPLPILGTATAFGWSRRLRQRIKEAGLGAE